MKVLKLLLTVFFFSILFLLFTIHFAKPTYAHSPTILFLAADYNNDLAQARAAADSYVCRDSFNHSHTKEGPNPYTPSPRAGQIGWSVTCIAAPNPPVQPPPADTPIGKITPPDTIPSIQSSSGDPSYFIAGLVRASLSILLIVAFILALVWTIFAGYRFIFAGGEPKNITAAWSQIYWGLLGMAVVLGAYAIIRLAEAFFGVNIVSGGFQLPQR